MSFPNLENSLISLNDIELDETNEITKGEYSALYRGQLSGSWENRTAAFKRFIGDRCDGKKEFLNELKFISNLINHENIIPFLGYCDEGEEMIIVYEFPVNGTLRNYLGNPDKRRWLTWQQRLEICMDAARGLDYLHSGLGQHGTVIHGSFMDKNILLDDNLKAKICGFEMSELIPGNQPFKQVYKPAADKNEDSDKEDIDMDIRHKDPIYEQTGFLRVESDIYSFGVLLFYLLTIRVVRKRPNSISMLVQHHLDNRLDSLIDPAIRDQIGGPSFRMIEEITCKCLSYNVKDRPTMDTVVKTIKEALDIHKREAISVKGSRGEYQNPREVIIPSEEMESALEMPKKSSLPPHIVTELYTAELSKRWPKRTVVCKIYDVYTNGFFDISNAFALKRQMFSNELEIVSRFHHENIISCLGHCDQNYRKILIYEHAVNGSLRDHLQDQDKLRCMPWEQRLKICLGAARGLKYLHSGLWDENRSVVHRHVRSEYILLDENMDAKISGFGLSIFVPRNKPQVSNNNWEGVDSDIIKDFKAFMDPIYEQSYIVNPEVDVYSFGLVMFEILSGMPARSTDGEKSDLIRQVHRHYGDNEMYKLIDPKIGDGIDGRSLQTFSETAYKCLSYNIKERPSMNRIVKRIEEALYIQNHGATYFSTTTHSHQFQKLEDLRIPLNDIKLATRDFNKNYEIGKGGFGVVYKGRLSESWTKHEAAFKRLNRTSGNEKNNFLKELKLFFMFHHQNIIRLVGYCDDGDEMILVSECAINGSLDNHLEDREKRHLLTWNKRLKICLGAAKGLDYLHSGLGEDNKVIHRDVKSGNILLDDNLEAKICDFGLSKSGLTYDHRRSKHYTDVAGTDWYMDPIYYESGILRTESDVYSFGVVMFEMLSGLPAYGKREIQDGIPRPLINQVRRYYDYEKELLIDPEIRDQIDNSSFQIFIETAYQCISFNSKERPSMETVSDKIEEALDLQVKEDAQATVIAMTEGPAPSPLVSSVLG